MSKTLPPDPENMNDDRAEWAAAAIHAFGHTTRMIQAGEDHDTIVCDLIADIMHWCDRNEVDFDDCLRIATNHYSAETES